MNDSMLLNETSPTSQSVNWENLATFFLAFPVFAGGLVSHALVFVFTFKSEAAKHQVSYIIASISLSEGCLCAYFGFWIPLMYATQHPLGGDRALFIGYIFFSASDNCDILLAFNRYIATYKPHLYKQIFSARRTTVYIVSVWIVALFACIPYSIPGCRLIAEYKRYQLTYEATPCGQAVGFGAEVFGGIALIATALNLLTYRKLRQQSKQNANKGLGGKEAQRRHQRELSFFIQSCVTSSTTSLVVLFVDFLAVPFHDKWSLYFLSTFFPIVFFSADGIAVLLLNGAIRRAMRSHIGARFFGLQEMNNDETTGNHSRTRARIRSIVVAPESAMASQH